MFLDDIDTPVDQALLQQVNRACSQLLDLKAEMEIKQFEADKAKEAYDKFACNALPTLFAQAGLSGLDLQDGRHLTIATKTRCSLKKDAVSKASVVKFLEEHNADNLIKESLTVPVSYKEQLQSMGIAFERNTDVNTNTLKALLIDMLGQNGGQAIINRDDIPSGVSFFQWQEAQVG